MPVRPNHDQLNAPVLMPPGQTTAQSPDEARRYRLLWFALAAVLLLGLAVIFALPALIQSPLQVSVPTDLVTAPGVEPLDVANQAMQDYLQLRAQLELGHASSWGEPLWSQSQKTANSGARMLAQRQFSEAAELYQQALQSLEQLANGREDLIAKAVTAGQQALDSNQVESAVEQFSQALAIQADNEDARFGLSRSQMRPQVLKNMAAGGRAEAEGNLLAAQVAYQEAALLDPEYEPPTAAFNRVSEEMAMGAFQDAMTRTLTALDSGQLGVAGKALAEARALRPSNAAVINAQQRLTHARQQSRLERFRRQARSLVKAESWQAASNVYREVLATDSSAGFARAGLDKAEARLKLNRQFDHYLKKPDRLYAAEPLANAELLLSGAGSAPNDEPKLAQKISSLQQLVAKASTPVTVSLWSDGETDISIYHIGQLGAFTSRQLELLPGTYTVVGTRSGYRDIHKQLLVKPGKRNTALFIRCEEVI